MKYQSTRLITVKQAASILGVTTLTMRNWDKNGKFPASRHPLNNYRVYKLTDIEKLLSDIEESRGRKRPTKQQVRKLVVTHLKD